MSERIRRRIILEDGTVFDGFGFGSLSDKCLELVFNTSMVGYQEIITDLSYTDQAVVMTYPIIGNYGINEEDDETKIPGIGALIVHEYTNVPSNFRSTETLDSYMKRQDIVGISGVDTRELARRIRTVGSGKVLLTDPKVSSDEGRQILSQWSYAHDQVQRASTKVIREYLPMGESLQLHVVAIDCGIKQNIIRILCQMGCRVTVVPWNTSAEQIRQMCPDGIFLSNGPGDPVDAEDTIRTVSELIGQYPIFGICLGHQILSLAYGAKTYKLKFGHRGGNHPVKNLLNDHIEITSQNHSYAVDDRTLPGTGLMVTHRNILDGTVEGVGCMADRAFSIQYHPESAPGPQDSRYHFENFVRMMQGGKTHAKEN